MTTIKFYGIDVALKKVNSWPDRGFARTHTHTHNFLWFIIEKFYLWRKLSLKLSLKVVGKFTRGGTGWLLCFVLRHKIIHNDDRKIVNRKKMSGRKVSCRQRHFLLLLIRRFLEHSFHCHNEPYTKMCRVISCTTFSLSMLRSRTEVNIIVINQMKHFSSSDLKQ